MISVFVNEGGKEVERCASLSAVCWSRSSVFGVRFLEERAQLLSGRGLLLLHELGVTSGDPPAIRSGHGWTQRATGRRLQLLPVITTGPEPHSNPQSSITKLTFSYYMFTIVLNRIIL